MLMLISDVDLYKKRYLEVITTKADEFWARKSDATNLKYRDKNVTAT